VNPTPNPLAPLRRVAVFAHSETRDFDIELWRLAKQEHGTKAYLFCNREEEADYYRKRGADVFEEFLVYDRLLKAYDIDISDERALMTQAREWEERLGTTINELSVADRHLGRGFALGGFYHPRSRLSKRTTYPQMVSAFQSLVGFLEEAFRAREIDLVVNGSRPAALVGRRLGIPFRVFAFSRYRNFFHWGRNEFWETPEIEEAYGESAPDSVYDLDAPIKVQVDGLRDFYRSVTWAGVAHKLAYLTARQVWWWWRGYEKGKNYSYWDTLALEIRTATKWRELMRLSRRRLSDLAGCRMVFFPLQTEPELSMQGLSPEYLSQLSAITALARDLPAGVLLGVKDTLWAVGRRPADFYRQIAEFKNVVLIDPRETGQDCVRAADAVAIISGSTGFEAVVLGKPVVNFGRHAIYRFLPHCFPVDDQCDLKGILRNAVFANEALRAEWRRCGRRFINAVMGRSFDMETYNFYKKSELRQSSVLAALDRLNRSFRTAESALDADSKRASA
jgi:hypothetical protein